MAFAVRQDGGDEICRTIVARHDNSEQRGMRLVIDRRSAIAVSLDRIPCGMKLGCESR